MSTRKCSEKEVLWKKLYRKNFSRKLIRPVCTKIMKYEVKSGTRAMTTAKNQAFIGF